MIKKYKNFSIFKSKPNDNEKAPTHRMSMKNEGSEIFLDIGACWTKETKAGDRFLSAKLSDIYVDHTDKIKSRRGYVIVDEQELEKMENEIKIARGESLIEDIPEEDRGIDAF